MVRVGDYDLDHQIGAGASGTVWKAHHRGPVPRVVALKRLRAGGGADELARLRREATVLAELDHPHVVRVLEVIHDGDGVAVAMQFAPGGSLEDLLAERGRLAPGQVVALAAPIAEALASAHRRGVVHGDVKPANVLFTSDGEPLLGDFGVARTLGQVTSDQVTGTAEYLAPELLDGARPDQRTDVYALGVVCYQALAGRPPYTGPAPLAVARAAEAGEHPRLDHVPGVPGVPGALARVVERAMHRDRGCRYAAADELARALRTTVPAGEARLPGPATAGRAADADPDATRPTRTFGPRPPRPQPAAPRRRWPRRPLALAGAGLVAAGLLYAVRDGGAPVPAGGEGCAPTEPPAAPAGARVVSGDVAGDGCTVQGVYAPQALSDGRTVMVLTIAVGGAERQIGLGGVGDEILLGDWDCDGVDTPGLYRRAAGLVQYFDEWPAVAERSYQPARTEQAAVGAAAVRHEGSRTGSDCDRIVVAP